MRLGPKFEIRTILSLNGHKLKKMENFREISFPYVYLPFLQFNLLAMNNDDALDARAFAEMGLKRNEFGQFSQTENWQLASIDILLGARRFTSIRRKNPEPSCL